MEGTINLQLSAKSGGVFETFYNSVKLIQIINSTTDMLKPEKIPSGKAEIPFEFPLLVKGSKVLYETYHGMFVNIQYTLRCDMRRSLLGKDLTKTCEFIVQSAPRKWKLTSHPIDFTITPEILENVGKGFTSQILHSDPAIWSIELQLVWVETCVFAEDYASEIGNIQIADAGHLKEPFCPVIHGLPQTSPVQHWKPPTSKWGLRLILWYFMLTTSLLRTSR